MKWKFNSCVILMGVLAFSGCEGVLSSMNGDQPSTRRNIKTPAERLVGHWQMYSHSNTPSLELYFSGIDPETHRGSFILIDPEAGIVRHQYQVLSMKGTRDEVSILHYTTKESGKREKLFLHPDGENGYFYRNFMGDTLRQRISYLNEAVGPNAAQVMEHTGGEKG